VIIQGPLCISLTASDPINSNSLFAAVIILAMVRGLGDFLPPNSGHSSCSSPTVVPFCLAEIRHLANCHSMQLPFLGNFAMFF